MRPPHTQAHPDNAKPSGETPASASIFSLELAVRDHARLAERFAHHESQLRQASAGHQAEDATRARLDAFLTDELMPYMRSEETALYAGPGSSRRPGWLGRQMPRRARRRLRDHRRIIAAADTIRSAETAPLALTRAERLRTLFDKHLAHEDRELLAAERSRPDDRHRPSRSAALATELQEILVQDHARIAGAITRARDLAADLPQELDACDRATAALSQHAAVMATRAYPMARHLLTGPDRAGLVSMRHDLRCAERALRHLNRTLRGAAGEDFDNRERLWDEVDQAWQRHITDEEPLIRSLTHLLRPDQALSLIAPLRRPAGLSLTRQHPALLRGGWPTRAAIHAQHRIDRWRDILDNRGSLRTAADPRRQNQLDRPVLDPAEALAETHANVAANHETPDHTN